MSRKQFSLIVLLVIMSGFAGGAIMTWMTGSTNAYAQLTPTIQDVVKAKEIHLIDEKGNVQAIISLDKKKDFKGLSMKSSLPWIGVYDGNGTLSYSLPPQIQGMLLK